MLQLMRALLLLGSHPDQTKEELQATKLLADLAGGVAPVTDIERLGLSVTTVPRRFRIAWLVVSHSLFFLKKAENLGNDRRACLISHRKTLIQGKTSKLREMLQLIYTNTCGHTSVSIKNTADNHKSCQPTVHTGREKKAVTLVVSHHGDGHHMNG